MGFWGTGLSSNDMFLDVYNDFFQNYNEGLKVSEISKKLIQNYQLELSSEEYSTNFWFALAKSQWECKALEKETFLKVESIIENDIDIKIWENFEASKSDLKKRKVVLDKFLNSLKIEKEKSRVRKKPRIRQPKFAKGDCFIFKLNNGSYGGAIVLEELRDTQTGLNLIAFTRMNKVEKPTLADFKHAKILIKDFGNWDDIKEIVWYFPDGFNEVKDLIEIIGKLPINKTFDHQGQNLGFSFTRFSEGMFESINLQFDFEKNNSKPDDLKLNEFLK